MLNDQIRITVKYFRLKKYLIEKLDYNKRTAVETIRDIRKMTPVIRKAFLVWFTTGKTPEGDLCGINYNNLLTYRNLNPVSAFLAIDWYVKDPKNAEVVLARPIQDRSRMKIDPTDDYVPDLIKKIAAEQKEIPENKEDITE